MIVVGRILHLTEGAEYVRGWVILSPYLLGMSQAWGGGRERGERDGGRDGGRGREGGR